MVTPDSSCDGAAIVIAPSILAADPCALGAEVASLEGSGAQRIHVDIMDGRFVPNITFGFDTVQRLHELTSLPLELHLMIVEPERHLERFAACGAAGITVHVEVSPHLHRTLQTIRELGCNAGAAINPGTPETSLFEVTDLLDCALVMTVNPGFGGQRFIPAMLSKVRRLRHHFTECSCTTDIEVDGGITPETAEEAVVAGATTLVAGTSIFHHPEGAIAGVHELQSCIAKSRQASS
ncbi:MAG: ribulose-phosphate 3-epimerase [Candidatus Dormibacteria bacterium]